MKPCMETIKFFEHKQSSMSWTPEQLLEESLQKVKSGEKKADKMFVIFLNDKDENYNVSYSNSGMSCSECASLLDIAKSMIRKEMGY